MSKHHPELVAEIEAFVAEVGMSEITFGRKAMSDPHFVRDIRGTRRVWPENEQKVRDFITAQREEIRQAASSPEQAA